MPLLPNPIYLNPQWLSIEWEAQVLKLMKDIKLRSLQILLMVPLVSPRLLLMAQEDKLEKGIMYEVLSVEYKVSLQFSGSFV